MDRGGRYVYMFHAFICMHMYAVCAWVNVEWRLEHDVVNTACQSRQLLACGVVTKHESTDRPGSNSDKHRRRQLRYQCFEAMGSYDRVDSLVIWYWTEHSSMFIKGPLHLLNYRYYFFFCCRRCCLSSPNEAVSQPTQAKSFVDLFVSGWVLQLSFIHHQV